MSIIASCKSNPSRPDGALRAVSRPRPPEPPVIWWRPSSDARWFRADTPAGWWQHGSSSSGTSAILLFRRLVGNRAVRAGPDPGASWFPARGGGVDAAVLADRPALGHRPCRDRH